MWGTVCVCAAGRVHVCGCVHGYVACTCAGTCEGKARCQDGVFAFGTSYRGPPSESKVLNERVLLPWAWRAAWNLTLVPTWGDICKDRAVLAVPEPHKQRIRTDKSKAILRGNNNRTRVSHPHRSEGRTFGSMQATESRGRFRCHIF